MKKCNQCGAAINTRMNDTNQILSKIQKELDRFGFLDAQMKKELANAVGMSVRQLEKYIKILTVNKNNVPESLKFIDELGSLNKAYSSTINKSEDSLEVKIYKKLAKEYKSLGYKDFVYFLENYK